MRASSEPWGGGAPSYGVSAEGLVHRALEQPGAERLDRVRDPGPGEPGLDGASGLLGRQQALDQGDDGDRGPPGPRYTGPGRHSGYNDWPWLCGEPLGCCCCLA